MQLSAYTFCFENECCRLELDQDAGYLILNWKGLVPSGPFREVHEQVLLFLRRYRLSKVLANARQMKTIGSADLRWLETHWLPQARQAGFRFGAVVESENVFNQLVVNSLLEKISPEQFSFRQFQHLEPARQWLKNT